MLLLKNEMIVWYLTARIVFRESMSRNQTFQTMYQMNPIKVVVVDLEIVK